METNTKQLDNVQAKRVFTINQGLVTYGGLTIDLDSMPVWPRYLNSRYRTDKVRKSTFDLWCQNHFGTTFTIGKDDRSIIRSLWLSAVICVLTREVRWTVLKKVLRKTLKLAQHDMPMAIHQLSSFKKDTWVPMSPYNPLLKFVYRIAEKPSKTDDLIGYTESFKNDFVEIIKDPLPEEVIPEPPKVSAKPSTKFSDVWKDGVLPPFREISMVPGRMINSLTGKPVMSFKPFVNLPNRPKDFLASVTDICKRNLLIPMDIDYDIEVPNSHVKFPYFKLILDLLLEQRALTKGILVPKDTKNLLLEFQKDPQSFILSLGI